MSDIVHQNFGVVQQKSEAAYESAPLGAELLSASGWTSTDWTGDWASRSGLLLPSRLAFIFNTGRGFRGLHSDCCK